MALGPEVAGQGSLDGKTRGKHLVAQSLYTSLVESRTTTDYCTHVSLSVYNQFPEVHEYIVCADARKSG
jgi:hypothetical protein